MALFIASFFAGVLTILTPCILPVLPIIVGGSLANGTRQWKRPIIITVSLALSVVLFTLLLKFSTAFIAISPHAWTALSGGIIAVLGFAMLYPRLWDAFAAFTHIGKKSEQMLAEQSQKSDSPLRDIAVGAALGPVFSSCSPTYFFILATVLPSQFGAGILYLTAYALGLSFMLFVIGMLGQKVVKRVRWAANPNGWFKKVIGFLFLLVGLAIITGVDKKLEGFLVNKNYIDVGRFEERFLNNQ